MSGSGERQAAIEAPAKVNLRLRVLAREESGFHSLETVFCAISLSDQLRIVEGGPGIRLHVEGGGDLGPPERNLAVRAAHAFFSEVGQSPAIEISLRKHTPSAAGLGGGSSDAAAVLVALNALHGDPLPRPRLLQLGIALGSDVPFFLCGSPLALAWGRGERLLPLPPLPPRPLLVAHPGEAMPTAEAFAAIAARRGAGGGGRAFSMDPADLASWEGVERIAENDFGPVLRERIPRLGEAEERLRAAGARVVLLAGSGSSIFGVFGDDASRDAAAPTLAALGFACFPARSLDRLPAPRLDLRPRDG